MFHTKTVSKLGALRKARIMKLAAVYVICVKLSLFFDFCLQVMKFLSQINCSLLQSIYRHYWPDFYLFGYSMHEYQQYANGGHGCNLTEPY